MMRAREPLPWALGVLVGFTLAVLFKYALLTDSYNVWGAFLVIPAIVLLNLVVIYSLVDRTAHPAFSRLLELALAVRLTGALARYAMAYVFYGGAADAERYNLYAAGRYILWREGYVVWDWGGKQGTQWMELITTAVYTVIGPSPLAAFLVFASFSFWGSYLIYRAFVIAVPDGDHRQFALLVFFLPSLNFWASSIGKEAWLMFFIGYTAYGAARFFTSRPWGLTLLALGAVGTALIRPHLSVLLFAALVVAQLLRPARTQTGGNLAKLAALALLAGAGWILVTQSAQFLGIDDFSYQAIADSVTTASDQASESGSTFTPVSLSNPLGVPMAFVTILFRPFVFETRNPAMLIQSIEGMVVLYLLIRFRPRLRPLLRLLRTNPFALFSALFVLNFTIAFAGFGNFGILARQRVLMLPFFLMMLALPIGREPDPVASPEWQRAHARA